MSGVLSGSTSSSSEEFDEHVVGMGWFQVATLFYVM
jgi:hypothetical protein